MRTEIIGRIVAAEKDGVSAMEAELRKTLESGEGQNAGCEFLVRIMNELMNRTGELWWDEGSRTPPKEITGGYLYLIDRVAEYAKQQLNAENYHRFCVEARFMLF